MAVFLSSPAELPDILYSSDFPDLFFETDSGNYGISVQIKSSTTTILDFFTRFSDGKASFYGVADAITTYMRNNNAMLIPITVAFSPSDRRQDEQTLTVNVVRVDVLIDMPVADFVMNNFLTSSDVAYISEKYFSVPIFINYATCPVKYAAKYRCKDGSFKIFNKTITDYTPAGGYSLMKYGLSYQTIVSAIKDSDSSFSQLVRVTYSAGNRVLNLFYTEHNPTLLLRYINVFGRFEYLYLDGKLTNKPEYTSQIARLSSKLTEYDKLIEDIYEFESENISSLFHESVSQMLRSPIIEVVSESQNRISNREIVISDASAEFKDVYEGCASLKFKFRVSDASHIMNIPEISSLRVFSGEFDETFS